MTRGAAGPTELGFVVTTDRGPELASAFTERALDSVEVPKVQRAQQLLDDIRSPDEDDFSFITRDDPRLKELEDIVDGLTPETPDSESDFERVSQ